MTKNIALAIDAAAKNILLCICHVVPNEPSRTRLLVGLFVIFSLLLPHSAEAQTRTWDITGGDGAAITGGAGTWDTTTTNWNDGTGNVFWASGNSAVFSGSGGLVTLGESITAGGLTFNSTGYTIGASGGTNTITLGIGTTITKSVNTSSTINANLISSGAISIAGDGNLILNGDNSGLTGGVTVGGANTVSLGNANALGTGTITIAADNAPAIGFNGAFSVTNAINLQGNIWSAGSQTNSYSGAITVTGANRGFTLWGRDINQSGTVALGANSLSINRAGANLTMTMSGAVSGTGGVVKNGTDTTLVLSGNNTFTGGVTFNGGTIRVGTNNSALGTGALLVNSAAANTSQTNLLATASGGGARTLANNIVINNNGTGVTTLALDGGFAELTLTGAISGNGRVQAQSTGVVVLRGANTYTGGTVINGGILSLGTGGTGGNSSNVNALGSGGVTINSGGTLRLWIQNSNSFTIANNLAINGGTLRGEDGIYNLTGAVSVGSTGANLTTQWNGKNLTLSGVVSGSGPIITRSVNESGSQVILSGANTFTGPVTVASGTLSVGSFNSVAGGTTSSNLGAPITVANGTIGMGSASTTGNLIYTGTGESTDRVINLAGTNGGATIAQSGTGHLRFSSNLSATGVGSKTLTLSGSTLGTGEIVGAIVNNGTAGSTSLAATFASGATTITLASVDGVTVGAPISGTGIAAGTTVTAVNSGTRVITLSNAATAASSAVGSAYSVTGVNNVSSLVKTGTGTWTLSGANTYTGTTTISGGTLLFARQASLYNNTPTSWTASNLIVNSGSSLALNVGGVGEFTTGDVTTLLSGINGVVNNNGLRSGSAIGFDTSNAAGGVFTVSNLIANTTGTGGGAVGLRKFGAGDLRLTAANTFTGGTIVNGGTLDLAVGGGAGAIRDSLTVNPGATVRVSVANGLGNAQFTRVGNTTLNGGTLDIQNTGNNSITSALITMTGGTITGMSASRLDLRNNGAGNTNVTTNASSTTSLINVGSLGLPNNNATFNVASGTTSSGVDLSISSNIVNNAGTGGAGSEVTTLTKTGAGTLQLSGSNTFTGATNANAGTIRLANVNALQSSTLNLNGGNLTFDSSVSGNAFTFGGLTGTGNLALANNALTPAAVALSVGGNNSNTSYSGNLTGAGSLTKNGTGVLILSGTNTFAGSLGINSGTVRAGSASAIGNNSALNVGGGAGNTVFASADATSLTFNKSVSTNSGDGGITFGDTVGTGDLTFSGNLTRASGSSSRTVNVAGNTNVTFNGNLLSPGANASTPFIKGGTGTLTILGTGNAADVGFSNVVVSGGTLAVTRLANRGSASSLGTATNATADAVSITLDGGALHYVDGGGAASATNRRLQIGRTTAGAVGTIRSNATNASETITFSNSNSIAYGTTGQARTLVLGGSNTGSNTLASVVGDNGAGVVSLSKQDGGRWVLSGANTYTGATTIQEGTLVVNGSTDAASTVTVEDGGILTGTGSIGGNVNVLAGGTVTGTGTIGGDTVVFADAFLNPGASPGTLSFEGNLTNSGTITMELDGLVAGTQYDVLRGDGTGVFTFGGTLALDNGFAFSLGNRLTIFQGWQSFSGTFSSITGTDLGNNLFWDTSRLGVDGSITVTAVPEPSTLAVLCLLGGIGAYRLRRRNRQNQADSTLSA